MTIMQTFSFNMVCKYLCIAIIWSIDMGSCSLPPHSSGSFSNKADVRSSGSSFSSKPISASSFSEVLYSKSKTPSTSFVHNTSNKLGKYHESLLREANTGKMLRAAASGQMCSQKQQKSLDTLIQKVKTHQNSGGSVSSNKSTFKDVA